MSRPVMSRPAKSRPVSARVPKVGFVSLGCPKALVDSERILTQLRAEGYEVAPTYQAADVVVVNAGVKELLVISQDTSAYGSDLRYAAGTWRGRSYATRFIDLARALGELNL